MSIVSRCIQDIIKYWKECREIVFIVVLVIFVVAAGVRIYRRKNGLKYDSVAVFCYKVLVAVCDSIYVTVSFYITFGMRYVGERQEVQWIPFEEVWGNIWELPLLVENCLLFVPFGILTPLTFYRFRNWKKIAKYAFLLSILIESAQYIFQCGKTEVDDVILNCLGAMVGYGLFVLVSKRISDIPEFGFAKM